MNNRAMQAGFSLIEIMVVVLIMGLFLAVGLPMYTSRQEKARKVTTTQTLKNIEQAIEAYNGDVGQYPETLKDLATAPSNAELAKTWEGPYMKKKENPKDGWNRAIQYKVTPGAEHPYELYSYGKGGKSAPKTEWIDAWEI